MGAPEGYELQYKNIAAAIRALAAAENVEMNRPAVEAGLAVLNAGGDLLTAVMPTGTLARRENIVPSTKKAVMLLEAQGMSAQLL